MRVFPHSVIRVQQELQEEVPDLLAVEEPLSVRLDFVQHDTLEQRELMVTMRTPGHDEELISGFLLAEGIITTGADIFQFRRCPELPAEEQANRLIVRLKEGIIPDLEAQQRYGTINSACGVCGKTLISEIRPPWNLRAEPTTSWPLSMLLPMPDKLRAAQALFKRTGGLHGVGLFDQEGKCLIAREDVGRHNALDKVIGAALHLGLLPLHNYSLVLSGRIGFELVQKSLMAGCPTVVAVGAPSSLAVQLAELHGQTLIGFATSGRANIYTHSARIQLA